MSKKSDYLKAINDYQLALDKYKNLVLTGTSEEVVEALNVLNTTQYDFVNKTGIYSRYGTRALTLNVDGVSLQVKKDPSIVDYQNYQVGTLNRLILIEQFEYVLDLLMSNETEVNTLGFEDVRAMLQLDVENVVGKLTTTPLT